MSCAIESRRSEKRREKRLAAALLTVAVGSALACLWRYGPNAVPGDPRSDYEWFFYPQKVFLSHWLSQGIFPWWNPHLFCGYPTAESQQHSLFYPFSTIAFAMLSPGTALFVFLSIHIVLTGVLTAFSFGRCFRLRPLPAAAGSCIYLWGAVYMHRFYAGHFTITLALTWLPLAVGAIIRAVSGVRASFAFRPRWMIPAIVSVMCVIVAGAPQYIFYVFWAQAAVVAVAARAAWRPKVTALAVVWLAAVAGTAIYWLPSLIFIPYAARGWGQYPTADGAMTRLCVMLEYLLPYPVGNGREFIHFQRRGVWDTSGYCGTGAVLLTAACLACRFTLSRRLHEACTYGAAIIVISLLMLSGIKLPGFDFFRETIRATILLILGSAISAATALDALTGPASSRSTASVRRAVAVVCWGAVILCAISALTVALQPRHAVFIINHISEIARGAHPSAVAAFEKLSRDPWSGAWPMVRALLFAVGAGLLLLFALRVKRNSVRGSIIAAVLFLDPFVQHYGLITPRVLPGKSGWPDNIEPVLREFGRQNVLKDTGPVRVNMPTPMTHAAQLIPGLYEPFGFDALMPATPYTRHASRQSTGSFEQRKLEKDADYGVGFAVQEVWSGPNAPPEGVPQRERQFVFKELSSTATIAEIVARAAVFERNEPFITSDEVSNFVEPEFASLLPQELTTTRTIAVRSAWKWLPRDTPNEMVFDVQVSAPALLVVKSSWLPGWRVVGVTNKKARPMRVNGWMIGVPVTPQDKTVVLRYRPPYLITCSVISLTVLFALLLFTFLPLNRIGHSPGTTGGKAHG